MLLVSSSSVLSLRLFLSLSLDLLSFRSVNLSSLICQLKLLPIGFSPKMYLFHYLESFGHSYYGWFWDHRFGSWLCHPFSCHDLSHQIKSRLNINCKTLNLFFVLWLCHRNLDVPRHCLHLLQIKTFFSNF